MMDSQPPRAEFTDVDHASDPNYYVRLLDYQHTLGFKQLYKQQTFALLRIQPGHMVLDVGCGTGQDVLAMAKLVGIGGHSFGVDVSQTMIDEAVNRQGSSDLPVTFRQGDVYRLEFDDNYFDCCRADRTFQHLANPRQALSEIIRVTKPGGKLLIVDPDHDSVVIDSPYKDVTRRFLHFRSDTLQQGGIAHHLYALFGEFSLTNVAVIAMTEVVTDYEAVRPIAQYERGMHTAAEYGVVTREEAELWIAWLEEAVRTGRYFSSMTYFITIADKPLTPRTRNESSSIGVPPNRN
jgi:ubiquinone/menaquinone biosynthesis C-methylase UbiE